MRIAGGIYMRINTVKGVTDSERPFFIKLNGTAVSSANAYNWFKKVYTILSFWKNIIQQKSKNSGNALNTNVMINLLLLQ